MHFFGNTKLFCHFLLADIEKVLYFYMIFYSLFVWVAIYIIRWIEYMKNSLYFIVCIRNATSEKPEIFLVGKRESDVCILWYNCIYNSVSVSCVQPQFFSIGCAVNHHRQLFNVQRYGSPGRHQTPVDALPIGEDFLQQTSAIRDWVFYKNSLPIVWLTALLGCHLLKHVKRLRWWRLCRNDSKKNLGLNETESP